MSELYNALKTIESNLDNDSYHPGPWGALLEEAATRPREERLQLSDAVTRVSDKLHARKQHPSTSAEVGIAAEILATGAALVLLALGLRAESLGALSVSAAILAVTFQPLLKVAVGQLLGIRYSYAYLWKIEPRFKMQYGTYLAAKRWQRVAVHASGCVGTPLALWLVGVVSTGHVDALSRACALLFTLAVGGQVLLFVLAFAGFQRIRPVGLLRQTSAGGAAYELQRNAP